VAGWARGVRSLVVLSGAGISTDSGIQDFRGPSGIWTLNPDGPRRHTYRAFLADPDLRASYWKSRYEHPAWQAEPNAGHVAVASLAGSDIDTTVVTQNTDGLHQRAGTPADRVLELHGTMHVSLCVECGQTVPTAEVLRRMEAGEATPPCRACGGILKTASTMFGQTMLPAVYQRAERAVTTCDLVLAVGTTLTIEPAGSLCASAVNAGATLVIVNWDPTPYDGIATEIIRESLSEALPRIADRLRAAVTLPAQHVSSPLPVDDEEIAAAATAQLVGLLADSTPEQDRHVLTVLARAALTGRDQRLTELLSVLPGLSPAAVEVALTGDYAGPLADALTSLVKNAALPEDLLYAIPHGTTVLGEFPVLLAQSLVEAYEERAALYPRTALPGLAKMLTELAARLADLGRTEEALAAQWRVARMSN
jgi:NAD-dependent SIR2 family protein deacetylase